MAFPFVASHSDALFTPTAMRHFCLRVARSIVLIAPMCYLMSGEAQNNIKNSTPTPPVPLAPSTVSPATPTAEVKAACLLPKDVTTAHLYGLWQVAFYDGPLPDDTARAVRQTPRRQATVQFERHPEHDDSLRGTLRDAPAADTHIAPHSVPLLLSGDLDEGELILDESQDGRRISAVWVAYPTAAGCGRELRGNRRQADSDALETLILTRVPGWR